MSLWDGTSSHAFYPDVAIGPTGSTLVVWYEQGDDNTSTVKAGCRSPGGDWAETFVLSGDAYAVEPTVVSIGDTRFLVVWLDATFGGKKVVSSLVDCSSATSTTELIGDYTGSSILETDLSGTPDNLAFLAIASFGGQLERISLGSWEPDNGWDITHIGETIANRGFDPAVFTTRGGRAVATWFEGESLEHVLRLSDYSAARGSWSAPWSAPSRWPFATGGDPAGAFDFAGEGMVVAWGVHGPRGVADQIWAWVSPTWEEP